ARFEGQLDVKEAVEALAEQTCADEKYDCYGELEDDEVCSEAAPERSGGATVAVVKRFAHPGGGEPQDRCEREDGCCKQSYGCGEEKNMRVEAEMSQVWHAGEHVFGDETEHEAHGDGSSSEAGAGS